MQTANIDEIKDFLYREGWRYDTEDYNGDMQYFEYPLKYDEFVWTSPNYYNQSRIELYKSTNKPNIVAYYTNASCYESLIREFNVSKGLTFVQGNISKTIFNELSISIEFRTYYGNNSEKKNLVLVYNTNSLKAELKGLKDIELREKKLIEEKNRIYQNIVSEGDLLFKSGKFLEAKLKFQIAYELDPKSYVLLKLDECQLAICNDIIEAGDSLMDLKQYDIALNKFSNVKDCQQNKNQIESRIDQCKDALCNQYISLAESSLRKNEFENALSNFNMAKQFGKRSILIEERIEAVKRAKVELRISNLYKYAELNLEQDRFSIAISYLDSILVLDPSRKNIQEKKNEVLNILEILKMRNTVVFDYSKTNNADLINFKRAFLSMSSPEIDKHDNGFFKMQYSIYFDTSGENNSTLLDFSTSVRKFNANHNIAELESILKPSMRNEYYLAAKENLNLNLNWYTNKISVKSTFGKLSIDNRFGQSKVKVNDFILRQPLRYGKFVFEVKNINLNGVNYPKVNLLKYKTSGPSAVFYSFLMPGWGTSKVTFGEKGKKTLNSFLLTVGLAGISKLYSNAQYKRYLKSTNQSDIDRYYQNANFSHQLALISAGVSATIYLYDICWVWSRGLKNKRESKVLRKSLRKGPITVDNNKVNW